MDAASLITQTTLKKKSGPPLQLIRLHFIFWSLLGCFMKWVCLLSLDVNPTCLSSINTCLRERQEARWCLCAFADFSVTVMLVKLISMNQEAFALAWVKMSGNDFERPHLRVKCFCVWNPLHWANYSSHKG